MGIRRPPVQLIPSSTSNRPQSSNRTQSPRCVKRHIHHKTPQTRDLVPPKSEAADESGGIDQVMATGHPARTVPPTHPLPRSRMLVLPSPIPDAAVLCRVAGRSQRVLVGFDYFGNRWVSPEKIAARGLMTICLHNDRRLPRRKPRNSLTPATQREQLTLAHSAYGRTRKPIASATPAAMSALKSLWDDNSDCSVASWKLHATGSWSKSKFFRPANSKCHRPAAQCCRQVSELDP